MMKQQFSCEHYMKMLVLTIALVLGNNCVLVSGQNIPELATYQHFMLETIAPETAKNFLDGIINGTISTITIPNTFGLFITAQPRELAKANAIIELIDENQQFSVTEILPASEAHMLPDCQELTARFDNITIGNFSNPPSGLTANKAIIDVHNEAVIVIAPEKIADTIVNTVSRLTNIQQINDYTNQQNFAFTETNKIPAVFEQRLPKTQTTDIDRLRPSGQIFAQQADDIITPQQLASELFLEVQPAESATAETTIVPIPNGDDVVSLTLPNKLTLIEFLGLVGPNLRLDFMYNEPDLANAGEVTFNPNGNLQGPITITDLYQLLEYVLKFKGFVMTRGRGNLVTIVPEANALNIDPILVDPDNPQIATGDVVVMTVFELQNIDTTSAENFLDRMNLALRVEQITQTQTLIVTAYAHRIQRIRELLDIVDKPGKPRQIRFRKLQYTMAESLTPKLQTLAERLGTVSIKIAESTETDSLPTRPTQNANESDTAYNTRLRAWQLQVQRAQQTAATARSTSTTTEQTESLATTVFLDADERTNRILMIGMEDQLREVEELIDTLDVAQEELRNLQRYKIENLDAEEVKLKLEELGVISSGSTSNTSSNLTGDIKQPVTGTAAATTTRTATPSDATDYTGGDVLVGEPQVVVIESTNSLLINATDEQHQRIVSIISHVDSQIDEEEIPYQIYQLKNQNPEHVYSVLEPLVLEVIEDEEGKIQSLEYKQADRITIVPDPNTSSLIVYANKKNQDWIGNLIEKLDKRRPQVLIDVTLVQISKTEAFDYDLNIISSIPDLTNTSGLTSAIIPGIEGTNLVAPLLNSGRNYYADMQANSGVGTGFYGDRHINALLTAMQQKDYGRVLAKPKLLVNDNEEGMIENKDITYVTTQTGTLIEGVQNPVQTELNFEEYDAGITLTITPHISESDLLRLDILLTRSDFGTITGTKPPDVTNSTVDTTVTIPDGSTIILGGLQKLNQSKAGTKVPLLGDIPLIGGAFRTINNSDIQRNLYVFVKAEIIRPTDTDDQTDLNLISETNREAFEEDEYEFQEYQSIPGFNDPPMKPFKVLNAR
ncbi:secretin N-terminal domain-containing protein [Planctomycetota bacterium]